ncbi:copper amine oxidase N-terminal domain-containing protein [Cytobacillus sp. Hz8]|uniref:copper amine oxidase N-terminal domain-containing protein n=1 Tax=Cytobacillus sp. Hz8 TaxID=3347168 RepID=UPI0035D8A645
MKMRSKWLTIPILITLTFGFSSLIVNADDDEHGEHEGHERYEEEHGGFLFNDDEKKEHDEYEDDERKERDKYEDDDENTEYYQDESGSYQQDMQPNTNWNIWTREAISASNNDLPFLEAQEVPFQLQQQKVDLFVLPQYGQFLVSGEKLGELLGAKTTFYSQSKILVISKGTNELILHAGTNAVYENMAKTPMPTNALYYENTLFVPVSVIANALDYRVSWDEQKKMMNLEAIQ